MAIQSIATTLEETVFQIIVQPLPFLFSSFSFSKRDHGHHIKISGCRDKQGSRQHIPLESCLYIGTGCIHHVPVVSEFKHKGPKRRMFGGGARSAILGEWALTPLISPGPSFIGPALRPVATSCQPSQTPSNTTVNRARSDRYVTGNSVRRDN